MSIIKYKSRFLFEINPLFRLYWLKLILNISSFDFRNRLANPLGWTHGPLGIHAPQLGNSCSRSFNNLKQLKVNSH